MDAFLRYILENWALILILLSFTVMLKITIFLDKKAIRRMYILIAAVFLLSIIVFIEFYLGDLGGYITARSVMMAIRYSATPIIIGLILYTLVKRARWYVLIPAFVFGVINIISIFTGIVFTLNEDGTLVRGVLGYLPYIAVGLYSLALVVVLFIQCNKQPTEIIQIVLLAFTLGSGVVLPFVFGKSYSKIFCITIAIALFVYYVFLTFELTKKDALTGLLNRKAYYASISRDAKSINAIVSIDMNGLKKINDQQGHNAGDEALVTVTNCFTKAARLNHVVYRIGGDEFMILCRKTNEEDLAKLIERIKANLSETKYTCSIGYCLEENEHKNLEEMEKKSDEMMYAEKAKYYTNTKENRRRL